MPNIITWIHLHSQGFLARGSAAYVSGRHFSLIEAGSEGRVPFEEPHHNLGQFPQDVAGPTTMRDPDSSDKVC